MLPDRCRFCRAPNTPASAPWDTVMLEHGGFQVMPSKGAMVEGWLLVVPNAHCLSLRELSHASAAQLDAVVESSIRHVAAHYGAPTLFEHGAATPGSAFGCGIDHAHLHVVPLPFNLAEQAASLGGFDWNVSDAPWRMAEILSAPYLAVKSPNARWVTATPRSVPRQFFRRVIAQELGRAEQFDYDEFPEIGIVSRTAGLSLTS